jgi:hypothetical protein
MLIKFMVNVRVATIRSKSTKVDVFKKQKPTKNKSVVSWEEKKRLQKIPRLTPYNRCK